MPYYQTQIYKCLTAGDNQHMGQPSDITGAD